MVFEEARRGIFGKPLVLPRALYLVAAYHSVPPLMRRFVYDGVNRSTLVKRRRNHCQRGVFHTAYHKGRYRH